MQSCPSLLLFQYMARSTITGAAERTFVDTSLAGRSLSTSMVKRLSGASYPNDFDVIELLHHLPDHLNCLIRVQDFCCDPRAAFIHAVKITYAVIALDIASWCNRDMTPAKRMTCLL